MADNNKNMLEYLLGMIELNTPPNFTEKWMINKSKKQEFDYFSKTFVNYLKTFPITSYTGCVTFENGYLPEIRIDISCPKFIFDLSDFDVRSLFARLKSFTLSESDDDEDEFDPDGEILDDSNQNLVYISMVFPGYWKEK